MVFSSVRSYLDPPNWIQQPTFQHELGAGGGASGNLPSTAAARAEENPARSGWAAERARQAKVSPPQGSLKCPRCESTNTKFCYFNNYSLSQPRHFCKTCRRYWTRGGTLRNVPVGGGCRRNKRSKNGGGTSKSAAVDRLAGSSTSSVASPCGASPPLYGAHPTQLPFMDYLAAANVRFSLPYSQLPGTVNRQFSSGVEEWGIEQVQELSHLAAPPTSSLELLHFQEECTASQLSLLKMEENSQPSTFPEQNLGIIGGDFLGGNFNGGGWAELSGFNASTICNLL